MDLLGLKSIEMQVALPRTQDAGKLQEQLGKRHQHFQESHTANQLKQEELKRKKINNFEQVKLFKNKKKHNDPALQDEVKKKESMLKEKVEHPYLGTKIDFNG